MIGNATPEMTVDLAAQHQLSEFACLVEAIPARFREAILTAAVENPDDNELGTRPFVVWMRRQLRECVCASLRFEVPDNCWEGRVPDAVRERLSQFSTCRNDTQVQLGVRELVSQVSECVLSSAKGRRS